MRHTHLKTYLSPNALPGDGATSETGQDDAPTGDGQATTGDETGTQKTFTQDDLDRVAGSVRSKARTSALEELLKELGIDNLNDAKQRLAQAEEARTNSLSETERLKEQIAQLTTVRTEADSLKQELEKTADILKAHVAATRKRLDIPAYVSTLLDNLDAAAQLQYLIDNESQLAKSPAPQTNASSKGGSAAKALTDEQLRQRKAEKVPYRL